METSKIKKSSIETDERGDRTRGYHTVIGIRIVMILRMLAHEILLPTLLLASFFFSISSVSSASTLTGGIEDPILIRYPELSTALAPYWLQEGTRATYYVIATSPAGDAQKTGDGLTQIDVVALGEGKAATDTEQYAPYPQGGMRPLQETGSITPVGCGDFWCNPEVLGRIPDLTNSNGLTVQRVPMNVGGKNYNAIMFYFKEDTLTIKLIYDLDTGILLHYRLDYVQGALGTNVLQELRDVRKVSIPWKDGQVPAWLADGATLSYQGQKVFQTEGAIGPPYSIPLSVQASVLSVHDRFAELKLGNLACVSGIAQLNGFWIPEGAAATLTPGVIDTDPDTGMQISVVESNANGIVFEKTNQQDYTGQSTYDSSGKLVQTVSQYIDGVGTVRTETLQLLE